MNSVCACWIWWFPQTLENQQTIRSPVVDVERMKPGHWLGAVLFMKLPAWWLQNCLLSCRPLWTDIHPANVISQWWDKWKSAPVVNSSLVDDPTIWQPGCDLHRRYWALLNRFWTNQGHCASCRKKCGLVATDAWQKPNNVTYCQSQSKLEEGLQWLHSADDVDTKWLKTYGS